MPGQDRLDGLAGVQLGEDRGQVVVDLEGQAQLVAAVVGAVAPGRVLLQLGVSSATRASRASSTAALERRRTPRASPSRGGFEPDDHLGAASLDAPSSRSWSTSVRLLRMEGVEAEDRAAHQGEHHPDDQAQPGDQLDADGPLGHGDDLLVVRVRTASRVRVRHRARADYTTPAPALKGDFARVFLKSRTAAGAGARLGGDQRRAPASRDEQRPASGHGRRPSVASRRTPAWNRRSASGRPSRPSRKAIRLAMLPCRHDQAAARIPLSAATLARALAKIRMPTGQSGRPAAGVGAGVAVEVGVRRAVGRGRTRPPGSRRRRPGARTAARRSRRRAGSRRPTASSTSAASSDRRGVGASAPGRCPQRRRGSRPAVEHLLAQGHHAQAPEEEEPEVHQVPVRDVADLVAEDRRDLVRVQVLDQGVGQQDVAEPGQRPRSRRR